jgi:hypothetical protein
VAINGKFVIDGVAHGFDARLELADGRADYRYGLFVLDSSFDLQDTILPDPYRLSKERFYQRMTPEAVASAIFAESPTDVACYHTIPAWGIWPDLSPIGVGLEIRDRHPGRMMVYGAVSPLEGQKAIDDLERQVEEWGIKAIKLYPLDWIDGRIQPWKMSDERVFYPLLQRCQELGVKTIAVHKAIPVGTAPGEFFRADDIDYPAADFPDLNFEIVHGGFTFLEETAHQLGRFANVYVNLEVTAALAFKYPRRFAEVLGEFMLWGSHEKILWGTGATLMHPRPLVEAFDAFEMPEDLMESRGYAAVTDEVKADIFANNFARVHGLDIEDLRRQIAGDEFSRVQADGYAEPWSELPDPGAVTAGA